jgi:hypothetical protein
MNILRLMGFLNASGKDTDAEAFISATGITNNTQKTAITNLVKNLKSYGLWSKMLAIYPFVGGTATTHKYNLKDPRDLDAAYRLSFISNFTHSSTGVKPSSSGNYANTFFSPLNNGLTQTNTNVSVYIRSISGSGSRSWLASEGGSLWPICASVGVYGGGGYQVAGSYFSGGYQEGGYLNANTFIAGLSSGGTDGTSRTNRLYVNGTVAPNTNTPVAATMLANTIKMWSGNGTNLFSTEEFAFASIGYGLSATEQANLYTAVQAYQTTLGRQV